MILIACVDDSMGMTFNHRRQSRDAVLCRDMLSLVQGQPLWMHPYSASLFPGAPEAVIADEDYLNKAGPNDFCFVEREDVSDYSDVIHTIVLYRWQRAYPSDTRFPLDLTAYQLTKATAFEGKSHSEILREYWVRRQSQ